MYVTRPCLRIPNQTSGTIDFENTGELESCQETMLIFEVEDDTGRGCKLQAHDA